MTTIVESIEVNVPVEIAYGQWIRFEEFPLFMDGVTQVTQLDATCLHWKAEIAGHAKEWVAKILEQTPEKRIAWTSREGSISGTSGAIVTLHQLSAYKSKVLLRVATDGSMQNGERVSLHIQRDLRRFKAFIEKRDCMRETGQHWRNSSQFYRMAA
jgi:uncharacterized membrane protein